MANGYGKEKGKQTIIARKQNNTHRLMMDGTD